MIALTNDRAHAVQAQDQSGDEVPPPHSSEIPTEDANDLKARGQDAANDAKAAPSSLEMTTRANDAALAAQSEAMQALVGEMTPALLKALGVEDEVDIEAGSTAPPLIRSASLPVVFVSSSIPLPTLRNYAAQLEPLAGVMVLRGGVGGLKEMGPTVDFIMNVLKVDPQCDGAECDMREVSVLIDPVLFRQSGVTHVPAATVVDHDPFVSYCERNSDQARLDAWRISYGDAALEGHLEELVRLGELKAQSLLLEISSGLR